MEAERILTILDIYRKQVIEVLGIEIDKDITISSAYSFISFEGNNTHIQFEINGSFGKLCKLYPDNAAVKSKIESASWPGLDAGTKPSLLSEEIRKHLTTADSIAGLAVNCAHGDNYRPGNFSEIILSNSEIELQQINHMNAKSLAHKSNYSLRSLIFRIDLENSKELEIDFNDRSSENNKHCGDQIKAAIANLASPSQEKP